MGRRSLLRFPKSRSQRTVAIWLVFVVASAVVFMFFVTEHLPHFRDGLHNKVVSFVETSSKTALELPVLKKASVDPVLSVPNKLRAKRTLKSLEEQEEETIDADDEESKAAEDHDLSRWFSEQERYEKRDVAAEIWEATRNGSINRTLEHHPKVSMPQKNSEVGIWYEILKSKIPSSRSATLIDVHGLSGHRSGTGGEMGILVATERKDFDVFGLGIGSDFGQEVLFRDVIRTMGLSNMMFGQMQFDTSSSVLELYISHCAPVVDYLILSSPRAVAEESGAILPHEYETLLGALFLLARKVYILLPLPETGFFASWASPEELAKASLRRARSGLEKSSCALDGLENVGIELIRNAVAEQTSDTTLEWLWASDAKIEAPPAKVLELDMHQTSDEDLFGFPLDFLRVLGLSHFNRQKLFTQVSLAVTDINQSKQLGIHRGEVVVFGKSETEPGNGAMDIEQEAIRLPHEIVEEEPFVVSYMSNILNLMSSKPEDSLDDQGRLFKALALVIPNFEVEGEKLESPEFTKQDFTSFVLGKIRTGTPENVLGDESLYREHLQETLLKIQQIVSEAESDRVKGPSSRRLLGLINREDTEFSRVWSSPGSAERLEAELLARESESKQTNEAKSGGHEFAHVDPGLEYDHWWPAVSSVVRGENSLLTIGSSVASVGAKVGLETQGTVVSIVGNEFEANLHAIQDENLGIHDHIICAPKQGAPTVDALESLLSVHHNGLFSFVFLGIDSILGPLLPSSRAMEEVFMEPNARSRLNDFVRRHWAAEAFPAQVYDHSAILPDESRTLDEFEKRLGLYLKLGESTLLCLPKWKILTQALYLVSSNETDVSRFVKSMESRYAFEMGSTHGWERVLKRSLAQTGQKSQGELHVVHSLSSRSVFIARWDRKAVDQAELSLYALLGLEVFSEHRKDLFRMYLDLPISAIYADFGPEHSLNPWEIFVRSKEGSLHLEYRPVLNGKRVTYSSRPISSSKDHRIQTILEEIEKEHGSSKSQYHFSLLNLYSGSGSLSMAIGRRYQSSTIVSVEPNQAKAEAHAREATETNVSNDIICNGEISAKQLTKLYESPEFFRFQVLGGNLMDHIRNSPGSRSSFAQTMGRIIGLSMTSFLELPSARAFSLAFATMFPPPSLPLVKHLKFSNSRFGVPFAPGWPRDAIARLSPRYKLGIHPLQSFRKVRSVLLGKLIGLDREGDQIQIQLTILEPHVMRFHETMIATVELVRIDLINMSRTVYHHFDHEADGHNRMYKLHVVRNETAEEIFRHFRELRNVPGSLEAGRRALEPGNHKNREHVLSVYLVRNEDDARIPYEELRYFTLVSALRMGMVESIKEKAWERFLKLPLYEDMAPWNIVFQGPQMEYIDYDTKQTTFDDKIIHAYRILSVLYNYKRTVADFGKCGEKAKTQYGFGYVSDCVGIPSTEEPFPWEISDPKPDSNSEEPIIKPPRNCPTSEKPVPCPDGKCHTDYINCLRAMEIQNQVLGSKEQQKERKKHAESKYLRSSEIWTFNSEGLQLDTNAVQG